MGCLMLGPGPNQSARCTCQLHFGKVFGKETGDLHATQNLAEFHERSSKMESADIRLFSARFMAVCASQACT